MEVADTYAVFKIIDIKGLELKNMNLIFDVGYPKGLGEVIQGKKITLSPKLVLFSPKAGSVGGTIIRANV